MSFTFRYAREDADSDGYVEMTFDTGENVRVQVSGAKREVVTNELPDGQVITDISYGRSAAGFAIQPGAWYRTFVEYNFSSSIVTVHMRNMDGVAVTEAVTAPIDASVTRLDRVRFYGVYHGTDIINNPPSATNYDEFRFITISPPPAPLNVTAAPGPGAGEISVAWSAPVDDPRAPTMHYSVFAGNESTNLSFLANTTSSQYTETGLGPNQTRYYAIAAVNVAGESPLSMEMSATTFDVPGAPGLEVTQIGLGKLKVAWAPPQHDGGLPPNNFTIYHGPSLSALVPERVHAPTRLSDLYAMLAPNSKHVFSIVATNDVGPGMPSTPVLIQVEPYPLDGDECSFFALLTGRNDINFTHAANEFCFVTEQEKKTYPPRYIEDHVVNLTKFEEFLDIVEAAANQAGETINRTQLAESLYYWPELLPGEPAPPGPLALGVGGPGGFQQPPDEPSGECGVLWAVCLAERAVVPPDADYDRSVYERMRGTPDETVNATEALVSAANATFNEFYDGIYDLAKEVPLNRTEEQIEAVQRHVNQTPVLVEAVISDLDRCVPVPLDGTLPNLETLPGLDDVTNTTRMEEDLDCVTRSLTTKPLEYVNQTLELLSSITDVALETAGETLDVLSKLTANTVNLVDGLIGPVVAEVVADVNDAVDQTLDVARETVTVPVTEKLAEYDVIIPTGDDLHGERAALLGKTGKLRPLDTTGLPAGHTWNASGSVGDDAPAVEVIDEYIAALHTRPMGGGEARVHPLVVNSRTCVKVTTVVSEALTPCHLYATITPTPTSMSLVLERDPTYVNNVDVTAYAQVIGAARIVASRFVTNGTVGLPQTLWANTTGIDATNNPQQRSFDHTVEFADSTMTRFQAAPEFGDFEFALTDVSRTVDTGNWSVTRVSETGWGSKTSFKAAASLATAAIDARFETSVATNATIAIFDSVRTDESRLAWTLDAPAGTSRISANTTSTRPAMEWSAPATSPYVAFQFASHQGVVVVSFAGTQVQPSQRIETPSPGTTYSYRSVPTQSAPILMSYGTGVEGCPAASPAERSLIVSIQGAQRCLTASGASASLAVTNSGGVLAQAHSTTGSSSPTNIVIDDGSFALILTTTTTPAGFGSWFNVTPLGRTAEWSSSTPPETARFETRSPVGGAQLRSTGQALHMRAEVTNTGIGRVTTPTASSFSGYVTSGSNAPVVAQWMGQASYHADATNLEFTFKATESHGIEVARSTNGVITTTADLGVAQNYGVSWSGSVASLNSYWMNAKGSSFTANIDASAAGLHYSHNALARVGSFGIDVRSADWFAHVGAGDGAEVFNVDATWGLPQSFDVTSSSTTSDLTAWASQTPAWRYYESGDFIFFADATNSPGVWAKLASLTSISANVATSAAFNTLALSAWDGESDGLRLSARITNAGEQQAFDATFRGVTTYAITTRPDSFTVQTGVGAIQAGLVGIFGSDELLTLDVVSPARVLDASWTDNELKTTHDGFTVTGLDLMHARKELDDTWTTVTADLAIVPTKLYVAAWPANATARLWGETATGAKASAALANVSFDKRGSEPSSAYAMSSDDHVLFDYQGASAPAHATIYLHGAKEITAALAPALLGVNEIAKAEVYLDLKSSRNVLVESRSDVARPAVSLHARPGLAGATYRAGYANDTGAFMAEALGAGSNVRWYFDDAYRSLLVTHGAYSDATLAWDGVTTMTFDNGPPTYVSVENAVKGTKITRGSAANDVTIDAPNSTLYASLDNIRSLFIDADTGWVVLDGNSGPSIDIAVVNTGEARVSMPVRPSRHVIHWEGTSDSLRLNTTSSSRYDMDISVETVNGPSFMAEVDGVSGGEALLLSTDRLASTIRTQGHDEISSIRATHSTRDSTGWLLPVEYGAAITSDAMRLYLTNILDATLTSSGAGNLEFTMNRTADPASIDVKVQVRSDPYWSSANATSVVGGSTRLGVDVTSDHACFTAETPTWDALAFRAQEPPQENVPLRTAGSAQAAVSAGRTSFATCADASQRAIWLDAQTLVFSDYRFDSLLSTMAVNATVRDASPFDLNVTSDLSAGFLSSAVPATNIVLGAVVGPTANGARLPTGTEGLQELTLTEVSGNSLLFLNQSRLSSLEWVTAPTSGHVMLKRAEVTGADRAIPTQVRMEHADQALWLEYPDGVGNTVAAYWNASQLGWDVALDGDDKPRVMMEYATTTGNSFHVAVAEPGARVAATVTTPLPAPTETNLAVHATSTGSVTTGLEVRTLWQTLLLETSIDSLAAGNGLDGSVNPATMIGNVSVRKAGVNPGKLEFLAIPDGRQTVNYLSSTTDFLAVEATGNAPYVALAISNFRSAKWTYAAPSRVLDATILRMQAPNPPPLRWTVHTPLADVLQGSLVTTADATFVIDRTSTPPMTTVSVNTTTGLGAFNGALVMGSAGIVTTFEAAGMEGGRKLTLNVDALDGTIQIIPDGGTSPVLKANVASAEGGTYAELLAQDVTADVEVMIPSPSTPCAGSNQGEKRLSVDTSGQMADLVLVYGTSPPVVDMTSDRIHVSCEDGTNLRLKLSQTTGLEFDVLACGMRFGAVGLNAYAVPFYYATPTGIATGSFQSSDASGVLTGYVDCRNSLDTKQVYFATDVLGAGLTPTNRIQDLRMRYADSRALDSCMQILGFCVKLLELRASELDGNMTGDVTSSASQLSAELSGPGDADPQRTSNLRVLVHVDKSRSDRTELEFPDYLTLNAAIPVDALSAILTDFEPPKPGLAARAGVSVEYGHARVFDIVQQPFDAARGIQAESTLNLYFTGLKNANIAYHATDSPAFMDSDIGFVAHYNGTGNDPFNVILHDDTCNVKELVLSPLPERLSFEFGLWALVKPSLKLDASEDIGKIEFRNRLGAGCSPDGTADGSVYAGLYDVPHDLEVGIHLQPEGYIRLGAGSEAPIGRAEIGYRGAEPNDRGIALVTEDVGFGLQWNIWPAEGRPLYASCVGDMGRSLGVRLKWDNYGAAAFYEGGRISCPDFLFKAPASWYDAVSLVVLHGQVLERFGCVIPMKKADRDNFQKAASFLDPWKGEVTIAGHLLSFDFNWTTMFQGDCSRWVGPNAPEG